MPVTRMPVILKQVQVQYHSTYVFKQQVQVQYHSTYVFSTVPDTHSPTLRHPLTYSHTVIHTSLHAWLTVCSQPNTVEHTGTLAMVQYDSGYQLRIRFFIHRLVY